MVLIELTHFTGREMTVNFCNVVFFQEDFSSTLIYFADGDNAVRVTESYEEIKMILEHL